MSCVSEIIINGVTYVPRNEPTSDFVVVRTYSAGVHVGYLHSQEKEVVILENARRVWRWRGANTLSELSQKGADLKEYTRISEMVPQITLTNAIEIIPCTKIAKDNLEQSRWLS